jgi:predicted cupin superfamily sugar epimerase
MMSAEEIIERFKLEPHPKEGGFYRETYRCDEGIGREALPERYEKGKPFSTAIYYLLTPDTCSALHRLPTDELFHFYLGDPVIMLELHPDGTSEVVVMGQEIDEGQHVQVIVPKGTWQGSILKEGGRFALLGTTVAPGFDFGDYEPGDRASLTGMYPDEENLIARLTPPFP